MQSTTAYRPKLWVPGDWNAFFGLGTNVLLNVLVLSGLALFVIKLPGDTVYGRILPALGIALALGNLLRLPCVPAGAPGGPRRRRGDALRPQRPALLLRDVRDHAAGPHQVR